MTNHLFKCHDETFSKTVDPRNDYFKEGVFVHHLRRTYLTSQSQFHPSAMTPSTLPFTSVLAERIGLHQGVAKDDVHRQLISLIQAKMNWATEEKKKHSLFSPLD